MTDNAGALAHAFVAMLNAHDADAVDRILTVDYTNHNRFVADGREANRAFWTDLFTAIPDLSGIMEDLVVAGDRVVGRFTYRGTHTGTWLGIPATGRPVEMRSIDIWRVEDGLFAEHWDELNTLEVFQQLGAVPPLP
jgi:steroid delta-isomerase-like uncharacterized protein